MKNTTLIEKSIRRGPGGYHFSCLDETEGGKLALEHHKEGNSYAGLVSATVWDRARRLWVWKQEAWKWEEAEALRPPQFEAYKEVLRRGLARFGRLHMDGDRILSDAELCLLGAEDLVEGVVNAGAERERQRTRLGQLPQLKATLEAYERQWAVGAAELRQALRDRCRPNNPQEMHPKVGTQE